MTTTHQTLGSFLRSIRIGQRISLNEICKKTGIDSTYYAKIELNEIYPSDENTLNKIFTALNISNKSAAHKELRQLMVEAEKNLSQPVSRPFLKMLPAFFRNTWGGKPTKEDLLKVLELIKSS